MTAKPIHLSPRAWLKYRRRSHLTNIQLTDLAEYALFGEGEGPSRSARPAETTDVADRLQDLKERIDEVRSDSEEPAVDTLLDMVVDNPPGAARQLEDAVRALKSEPRRRLSELLHVELAELKNSRGLVGEDLVREQQIEYLLGLFARLGEI